MVQANKQPGRRLRFSPPFPRDVHSGRLSSRAIGNTLTEPLCEFLGVPVPDVPFPHDNAADSFDRNFGPLIGRLALGPLVPLPEQRPS
jgi:hypothetical protein